MSAADLAIPLRTALIGESEITSRLTAYAGSWPVFTRRPMPTSPVVTMPAIMISPDISVADQDGIDDFRPIQQRDIAVYGLNDTATRYRTVEELGYAIREMFHGQRDVITVSGWHVIQINARGPIPAPVDDDQTVARLVTLTIELARLA